MEFNKQARKIVSLPKHRHRIIKEVDMYLSDDYPIFGLAEIDEVWMVVHLPSETPIFYCLRSKEDAELYMEYLGKDFDLNNILLFQPDLNDIENLKYDVDITYRKFYRNEILKKK